MRELEAQGVTEITSRDLGERMRLNPCQIRQDINFIRGSGKQGAGSKVKELKDHLQKIMGLEQERRIIVIGTGRTGLEIANHPAFAAEGFPVVALFDRDPVQYDQSAAAVPVYLHRELEEQLPNLDAHIAVLALPAAEAQEMLARVYNLGIRAIWNLATADLQAPRDMAVLNWYLYDSLHILSYRIQQTAEENSRR